MLLDTEVADEGEGGADTVGWGDIIAVAEGNTEGTGMVVVGRGVETGDGIGGHGVAEGTGSVGAKVSVGVGALDGVGNDV
jgi:hypothetical protein